MRIAGGICIRNIGALVYLEAVPSLGTLGDGAGRIGDLPVRYVGNTGRTRDITPGARVRKRNTRIALSGSGDPERLVSEYAPVGRSGEAMGKDGRAAPSKAAGSCQSPKVTKSNKRRKKKDPRHVIAVKKQKPDAACCPGTRCVVTCEESGTSGNCP